MARNWKSLHADALGLRPSSSSPLVTHRSGNLVITSILLESGEIASVEDLPRHGRPRVWCPFCGREGIYRKQVTSSDYTEHFAHHGDTLCTPSDLASALHDRAIRLLLEWLVVKRREGDALYVKVPCLRCRSPHAHLFLGRGGWDTEVREVRVHLNDNDAGYRVPDIVLRAGESPVALLEVGHTSLVDPERREHLEAIGVPGLELYAAAIVSEFAQRHPRALPSPRSDWNIDQASNAHPICERCRTVPAHVDSVVELITASTKHRPEFDAPGHLAAYIGTESTSAISPQHLLDVFRRPEALAALGGRGLVRRLALTPVPELVGSKLDRLTRMTLGWDEWHIWSGTDPGQRLDAPHLEISRRLQSALRDVTTLRDVCKKLDEMIERADQVTSWRGRSDAMSRFECLLTRELCEGAKHGHTAVSLSTILDRLGECLGAGVDRSLVEARVRELARKDRVVLWVPRGNPGTPLVALRFFGRAERVAAEYLHKRVSRPISSAPSYPGRSELDETQEKAVYTALTAPLSLITGAAGTGKSRTIREIIARSPQQRWLVLAPTWKALAALNSTLQDLDQGILVMTVARFNMVTCGRLPDSRPVSDFRYEKFGLGFNIVVDEVGFLDSRSFRYLVRGAEHCRHLILVGDTQQLGSIGPGAVLRDLSGHPQRIPRVHLSKVYRSHDDSGLPILSNGILHGRIDTSGRGVTHIDDVTDIHYRAADAYLFLRQRVHALDLQIISPFNWVCVKVNKILQSRNRRERVTKKLRIGDPFIATENVSDIITKGEMGHVLRRTSEDSISVALANGQRTNLSMDQADTLDVAYCITVHKSQGSQWQHVIAALPQTQPSSTLVDQPMLYTCVTRARQTLTLIAWKSYLRMWARSKSSLQRVTLLYAYLDVQI